jgi:hypothetical protein
MNHLRLRQTYYVIVRMSRVFFRRLGAMVVSRNRNAVKNGSGWLEEGLRDEEFMANAQFDVSVSASVFVKEWLMWTG